MMCGINTAVDAIKKVSELCYFPEANLIINRLEYHRSQAEGVKPKFHKGMYVKDFYTCGNCGYNIIILDNFCPHCGFMIKWDSCRCLTGLPLVDAIERGNDNAQEEDRPV